MTLSKSSGDNRTISQYTSKLRHTSTTKDQDTLIPGTTSIPLERHTLLSNLSKPTTPTTGSNSSGDKTSGKPMKEEYTTAQTSAGGMNQTLSIHITLKKPASLSLSQQLPQHFSSFLSTPTPQIIQPQQKDNRKKLMSLLAKPRRKCRGLTSSIPLTALSKEILHSYLMETEAKPASSSLIGIYGWQSIETITS